MGMFDYVEGEFKCPTCGFLLTDFQTKSGDCIMDRLDFRWCDYFYAACPECDSWVEVCLDEEVRTRIYNEMRKLRESLTADHYEVSAEKYEERYGEKLKESEEEVSNLLKDEEEA